ncbi:MAG: thiamine pyrophosphate-dependent enzyme [Candidatus Aenigmatarchaeota archaeon]
MLKSNQNITWCPGCTNFFILNSFVNALEELEKEKLIELNKVIIVCGIGCHGKIFDYLNLSGFNALHGRALPLALGIKVANKDLKVICFVGDGDIYSEGIEHLIHAARYNIDIKVFVHNNQTFALTVGQSTPTSQKGFKSKVRPEGEKNEPLDPILLLLASKTSFVARSYSNDAENLKFIMKEAIKHKGFAVVDILQPCISFNNFGKEVEKKMVKVERTYNNFKEALENYLEMKEKELVPIGIFLKNERKTFEELEGINKVYSEIKRNVNFNKLFENFFIK